MRMLLRAWVPVLLALVLAGCASRSQDVLVLRLAHALGPTHSAHRAMVYLGERLEEKSGGTIRVVVYPSQQLGSERELLELLQIGSLAMAKVSAAVLEGFVPEYQVFSLPYLFRDDTHRFKVLEGPIGQELLLAGERVLLRGLCYYDAGSRSFYTVTRPIYTPDDLRGLKIRTLESPTQIQMVNLMGASATPIPWGEVFTALQQGIVDGAENNPPSFYLSHHYEVARFYTLDEHTSIPDVLLISLHVWNRLTPQQRQWVQEAAMESAQYQKQLWKESTEEALRAVQEAGVEIIYPDKQPFVEKVQPIYEQYRDRPELNRLIARIKAVE
ncbi:TRAP dicarboxylate transporter, DctP subunit [Rhodothermus marinus SG0.5JP17-172]|uniref:TRAP transporter substrate-binding protein n=1 Tax=Rhodothermus marinus TaxID=29549 RepID=UPI000223DC02|nr:TRAP transporter substrate-binding protein [Rhodothermus marinus]AEN74177.1 TRAP dicarboxylate transporter, DctP subunit [Rhodothermus marinus SG0.5JP17-172]